MGRRLPSYGKNRGVFEAFRFFTRVNIYNPFNREIFTIDTEKDEFMSSRKKVEKTKDKRLRWEFVGCEHPVLPDN